jgi:hypothetical protein
VEFHKKSGSEDVGAGAKTRGLAPPYVDEQYDNYIGESAMFFLTDEQVKTLYGKSFLKNPIFG